MSLGMASGLRRRALLGADPFDPLSIDWHAAFWTEGPNFEAEGYSDGDPVSTWPDESANSHDATQATGSKQPTYRASTTSLNGQPTVEGASGSVNILQTAAFAELAQPNTIVAVVRFNGTSGSRVPFDGITSTKRHQAWSRAATSSLAMYAGTTITGGTQDTDGHLWIATFATTDTLEEDGTTAISGDAGAHGLTGLSLFNDNGEGAPMGGHIAFLGLKDGTLTSQEKSDLLAWAQSKYGTP